MRLFFVSMCVLVLQLVSQSTTAAPMTWNHKNADLVTVIEQYSKATGAKFVIDSTVRGKITFFNQQKLDPTEVFDQLSRALAINGFSWIKSKDTYVVRNARSIQRDNMEIFTELPPADPEHMVSFIYKCKFIECSKLSSELRLLTSSYGEVASYSERNSLIISDFTGNINRIYRTFEKLDTEATSAKNK